MKLPVAFLMFAATTCALAQTAPAPENKVTAMLNDERPPVTSTLDAVVLSSKSGDVRLQAQPGSFATSYAFVTVLVFVEFPEKTAITRIKDPRPTLHLKIGVNPRGRVYLVKARSNPKTNNRSVKVGHSSFGSVGGMTAPDAKWVVPASVVQESPGVWTLTPDANLKPGEYGIFTPTVAGSMQVPGTGDLYDFGVDP